MKKLEVSLSSYSANKLLKGDLILLQTTDEKSKRTKEFVLEIKKIVSDMPKCSGCKIFIDSTQSFEYGKGVYCEDCFKRKKQERINEH